MAQIRDNPIADGLAIFAPSKAAHVRLMDNDGSSLAHLPSDLLSGTSRGLISMGTTPGTDQISPLAVDPTGRIRTSAFTPLVTESFFSNTTPNPNVWQVLTTTMAVTQNPVSGFVLNSAASLAVNVGAALKSQRRMAKRPGEALLFRESARVVKVNNSIVEMGFADGGAQLGVTPTALLDQSVGAYWRYNAAGALTPVISFNNSDVAFGDVVAVQPLQTDYHDYVVLVEDLGVRFAIYKKTGAVVSEQFVKLPVGLPRELAQTSLSAFIGVRNSAVAPASAPRVDIGQVVAGKLNSTEVYSAEEASAFAGNFTGVLPNGLAGALVNVTSATAPTAVTLTNSGSTMGNALGGRGLFNALGGGETDYGLCALVNNDSIGVGMTYICTGYRLEIAVGTVAIATTPTVFEPFLFTGDSNNPNAAASRKMPLGSMYFPVGTAVGDSKFIDVDFPPVALLPNRSLGLGLRIPTATATATQTFRTQVMPKGYWVV
jgi:hypothetical protein